MPLNPQRPAGHEWRIAGLVAVLLSATLLLPFGCKSAGRSFPNPAFWQKEDPVPVLVQQAGSKDPDERRRAMISLGEARLEGEQAAKARVVLAAVLRSDTEPLVRAAAATSLGRLGTPTSLPPLRDGLQDKSELVRADSARALGSTELPEAIPSLVKALKTDENSDVRCAAAEALGHFNDTAARDALLASLDDSRLSVRGAASRALAEMTGARDLPPTRAAWEAWLDEQEQKAKQPKKRFLFF